MTCIPDTGVCLPQHDEVALVVVSYNPDDSFGDRARSLAEQFELVVIVDNSSPEISRLLEFQHEKIHVILNQDNLGLGHALNAGCEQALESGFKWVVTLDQDTELYADYLCQMLAALRIPEPSPVILGCNYFNVSRSHFKFTPSNMPLVEEKRTVITSGCLMYLPAWSVIGQFRADYFIDAIDHEFCLRARSAGFGVAVNLQSLMVHTIGERAKYHKLFRKYSPYTHSVWRVYTRTRNTVRTIMEYAVSEPGWCLRQVAGLSFDMAAIIFLEPKKMARLKAFSLGFLHGCQNKMGAPPQRIFCE